MENKKKFALLILSFILVGIAIIANAQTSLTDSKNSSLVKRTASSDTYMNPDGSLTTTLFSGNVFIDDKTGSIPHYVPWNSSFFPIKNSAYKDYEYELDTTYSSYQAYFQDNIQSGKGFRFEANGYWFTYDLSGGKMQWSEQEGNPTKTKSIGSILSSNPSVFSNLVIYNNSFSNTDVTYEMTLEGVKENFILKSNPLGSTGFIYLEYTGELQFDGNLTIWANGEIQSSKSFNTSNSIDFKDKNNKTIFKMPSPIARDSNGEIVNLVYDIKPNAEKLAFGLKVPVNFLDSAIYPVYIDPTVTLQTANTENMADVEYEALNSSGATGAFIKFNISSLSRAEIYSIVNVTLGVYVSSTYGTQKSGYLYNFNNQTWLESESRSFANQSVTNKTIASPVSASAFTSWDITDIFMKDYSANNNFTSIVIEMPNNFGLNITNGTNVLDHGDLYSGANNIIFVGDNTAPRYYFVSKEGDVSLRPKITITYLTYLNITLSSPKAQTYETNISLPLNYSVKNYSSIDTCWFYIFNSSGGYEKSNTSLTTCQNTTFNVSASGVYTLMIWVNTTLGSAVSENVTFEISLLAPSVVLNYPPTGSLFNKSTNIYFNYTSTDGGGLSTCELWGNWSAGWHKNFTWQSPTNATMNFTTRNISDGYYIWNVWCNDTSNNGRFAISNRSFSVDTIYPLVSINSFTTTPGSQTFYFNSSETDTNLNTCKYSVTNSSGGIDGVSNNISFTCNSLGSATTTSYGTFNLTIYALDLAGWENSSTSSFTTSASEAPSGGGGGGGTIVEKVNVISLIQPEDALTLSDIERAIVYSRIYNYSTKYGSIQTTNQKQEIISQLDSLDVKMSLTELEYWLEAYEDTQLEQLSIEKATVERYGLIQSTLLIQGVTFSLKPSTIDLFWIKKDCSNSSQIFESPVALHANKIISICSTTGSETGWTCSLKNSTIIPIYTPILDSFTYSTTFKFQVTSSDNESSMSSGTLRVIDICHKTNILGTKFPTWLITITIFIIVIIGAVLIFYSKVFKKWKKR